MTASTTHARRRAGYYEQSPKAILVMLKTRTGQIEYLTRHDPKHLDRFKEDISGAMDATLRDFSDHFKFCPVFFFADTMMNEVKIGHFNGVLLNDELKVAQQNVLPEGDTSFFVIDFGHLSQTSRNSNYEPPVVNLREILLAMDHNFEFLEYPRPAIARGYWGTGSSRYRDYWYRSKNYEVDYTPQAAAYSRTLEHYYEGAQKSRNP